MTQEMEDNRYRRGGRKVPIVERLYKENQETYTSAGGFDADDDEHEERRTMINEARQRKRDHLFSKLPKPDACVDCDGPLDVSFLWERFGHPTCDRCRNSDGAHKLIPRTEAKSIYLLKDCDLDLREPPLRYIAKKNPHNPRYGDMKLYLKAQLEERALSLHGSWEQLDEARQEKETKRETRVEKRFERNIKRMRKELQSGSQLSTDAIMLTNRHTHQYLEGNGSEEYDEKTGHYSKTCTLCGQRMVYDKL